VVSLLRAAGITVADETLFDAACRLSDIVHIIALHEGIKRISDITHRAMRQGIRAVKLVRDTSVVGLHPLGHIAKPDVKQSICSQF